MDSQERQVISDIFDRLKQVERDYRDPEAERFIADRVRQQPYAPYAMAQSLYVQEQALLNLNAEVDALRMEVDRLQRQPQGGGFLSSIFGGGSRQPESQSSSPWNRGGASQPGYAQGNGAPQGYGGPQGYGAPQGAPGPWGGTQQGMPQQRAGGGFLQGALTTAAGVAGGMMLGSVLSNAFGSGGAASALGGLGGAGTSASAGDNASMTDSLYGDSAGSDASGSGNEDDFGGDLGAGDDGDWS